MYFLYLSQIFIFFSLLLLQGSFFDSLVYPFYHINIMVPFLFFVLIFLDRVKGAYWFLFISLGLEFFSPAFPGFIFISLALCALLLDFLSRDLFPNRTWHGLMILTLVGSCFFEMLMLIFHFFEVGFSYWDVFTAREVFLPIFFNLVFVSILYLAWQSLISRFTLYLRIRED